MQFIKKLFKPHRVIGDNYLHRWHLIPKNRVLNIYLHHFVGSDTDRHMHDHPWSSVSFTLKGQVIEVSPYADEPLLVASWGDWKSPIRRKMPWLLPVHRQAEHIHRVEVEKGTWTIFITGPVKRKWYFWCDDGAKVHSKEYFTNGCA
jgi:hypothetical protein